MSDQTNPGGAGDFRGSAADKRKDETVMVNADDLSNLVANARQEPAPAAPAPVAPVAAPATGGNRTVVIAAVVVLILVLVALIAYIALS